MRTGINLKENKYRPPVSTSSNEVKQKKRNVNLISYTDDESDVDDTKNFAVKNKICEIKPLSESVNKTSSSVRWCGKPDPNISEQQMTMKIETNFSQSKRKIEVEEVVKSRKTQHYSSPQEVLMVADTADSEIEIVQEFLKSEKKICKELKSEKKICTELKSEKKICTELKSEKKICKELPTAEEAKEEEEEVDLEPREEGEDDRSTVIFEEELHTEDVLVEKVVNKKKFNEKEITNRKKQRLIRFKRKSMLGRNLLKFRKAKVKPAEVKPNPPELVEKPTENPNEECLKEVCGLVKRLHELQRIILQLQKELPKNGDLAIHFANVIRSQQENFNNEIRRSQRTIIKCYERLMMTYNDTARVALEICKRTFLNVEEVANIISKCVVVEVYSENADKTEKILPCKTSCDNSEKAFQRIPNRVTVGNSANQQLPLHHHCTTESVCHSNREPPDCPRKDVHPVLTKRVKPQIGPPRPPLRPPLMPPLIPSELPQTGFIVNLRPANGPSQRPIQCGHVRNQPAHTTPQYYRVNLPVVNTIPCSSGFQQNPGSSSRYIPALAVPSYGVLPSQVLEGNRFSVVAGNFRTVPPPSKVHPTRRPQIPVSVDSIRYSNSGGSFVTPVELPETTCRAELDKSAEQVLDPTVPQKLTLRNSRLEAGPALSLRAEYILVPETNTRINSSTEVNVVSRGLPSRKYVCAQNECKNPGVRICKRCRSVIYCSETCQLQHWTMKHKVECYQLMQLRG